MSQKESIVALSPLKEEDTIIGIFHWLASFGEQFAQKSLLSKVDSIRLLNDKIYASEEFIRSYAYARANAPLSYRINALKALKKKGQSSTTDTLSFYKMRVEKINENANPFCDPRFNQKNFCSIIKLIKEGKLYDAFNELDLKGLGSKIRTLFIRDMVFLYNSESNLSNEQLIFTQPIDIWIKLFIDEIEWKTPICDKKNINYSLVAKKCTNRWNDIERGMKIIEICKIAKVSPVLVNQAIWLFSSRVVADTKHLKVIINSGDVSLFKVEAALVKEFFI